MKLTWDEQGKRLYETGIRNGVLYPIDNNGAYSKGVAWNGLTSVTQSPSGAEANDIYADDIKYLTLMSTETFGATIEAYTYPTEFEECDGSAEIAPGVTIGQQARKSFGLCYRTVLGNDLQKENYGYKLHLIYGATASPSEKNYQTINDSPETVSFSWEITTNPVNVSGFKPTALIEIDSTKVSADKLAALENILYGTEGTVSYSATSDSSYDSTKTYYVKTGETYIEFVGTEFDGDTTYYERTEVGGTDARLPLPDEVRTLMSTVG